MRSGSSTASGSTSSRTSRSSSPGMRRRGRRTSRGRSRSATRAASARSRSCSSCAGSSRRRGRRRRSTPEALKKSAAGRARRDRRLPAGLARRRRHHDHGERPPLPAARLPVAASTPPGRPFLAAVLDVATRPDELDRAAGDGLRRLPREGAAGRPRRSPASSSPARARSARCRSARWPARARSRSRGATSPRATRSAPHRASRRSGPPPDAARPLTIVSTGFNGGGALYDPALAAHYGIAIARSRSRALRRRPRRWARRSARPCSREPPRPSPPSARRRRGAAMLHVASHAIADETDGSRTALLLAPDPGKSDGILTMGDLLELRLTARLVVLSGCRTARGETFSGESIGGLARAVLAAGARNLVASAGPSTIRPRRSSSPRSARSLKAGASGREGVRDRAAPDARGSAHRAPRALGAVHPVRAGRPAALTADARLSSRRRRRSRSPTARARGPSCAPSAARCAFTRTTGQPNWFELVDLGLGVQDDLPRRVLDAEPQAAGRRGPLPRARTRIG